MAPHIFTTCRRDRLYAAFLASGLTQEALARKAGLHKQVVNDILKGRRPGHGSTETLAKALGVSASWIDLGTGPEPWTEGPVNLPLPRPEDPPEIWREFGRKCVQEAHLRWEHHRPRLHATEGNLECLSHLLAKMANSEAHPPFDVGPEFFNLLHWTGMAVKTFGPNFSALFGSAEEVDTTSEAEDQDAPWPPRKKVPDLFQDLLHKVRDIVGHHYDKQGNALTPGSPLAKRHQSWRRLAVTAIPGAYEYASHVVITISGTPSVGVIVVPLTHSSTIFDINSHRSLTEKNADVIMRFLRHITPNIPHLGMVPSHFRWEIGFEDYYTKVWKKGLPDYHYATHRTP